MREIGAGNEGVLMRGNCARGDRQPIPPSPDPHAQPTACHPYAITCSATTALRMNMPCSTGPGRLYVLIWGCRVVNRRLSRGKLVSTAA